MDVELISHQSSSYSGKGQLPYIVQHAYLKTLHGGKRYASSIHFSNVGVVFWTMDVTAEQPRTTRLHGSACDTCRRRRVKCDGNQPCDRCTRSNVACTYGSVASRTSAVSYARQLEQKVAELQGLLRERPQEDSGETDIKELQHHPQANNKQGKVLHKYLKLES